MKKLRFFLLSTFLLALPISSYADKTKNNNEEKSILDKYKNISLFVGTIGPMLGLQGGSSAQGSFQFSRNWSIDVESGGYFFGGNAAPQISESFTSIGISFLLNDFSYISKILKSIGADSILFLRTSASYHDEKEELGKDRIVGRKISKGLEVSIGLRRKGSESLLLEIVPILFYIPLESKKSGQQTVKFPPFDRIIQFKVGLGF